MQKQLAKQPTSSFSAWGETYYDIQVNLFISIFSYTCKRFLTGVFISDLAHNVKIYQFPLVLTTLLRATVYINVVYLTACAFIRS